MKLVFLQNSRPVTDSLTVAETFGKRHADVLRAIENLECSLEFTERNFASSDYKDSTGRTLSKVVMTQDGFSFLVMGFTGKEAARFKEMYIAEFNRMRDELNKPQFTLPQSFPEALRLLAAEMEEKAIIVAEKERLSIQTAEQQRIIKQQETPVAIYNLAISAHNSMSMQEVAKSFGTGRTRLYGILREEGIVMKGSTLPYQRYIDSGHFKVVERPRASGETIKNDPATRVCAKGFELIGKIFKKRAERNAEEK